MNHIKRNTVWQWTALVIATAIVLCVVYFMARAFFILRSGGYIRPAHHRHLLFSSSGMSNKIFPTQVRGWMTFSYLNQQFNLPSDYLKSSLGITAKNYPNISIDSLASQQKKNPLLVLVSVEQSIQDYIVKPKSVK